MERRDERLTGSSRVLRGTPDDGSFDREFWGAMTPAQRLEAVWDLTLEYLSWKGDGDQPRLQRLVCRVERDER